MHITNDRPTAQAYGELQMAYDHFNRALFAERLPPCLITLQRKGRRTFGYYAASRFGTVDGKTTDEIAMNPLHFKHGPVIDVLSTLVHEMVHLWQQHFGRPSRSAYHNREWAGEMLRIGLHPSDTGRPGGRMTGQQMSDYVLPGGRFEQAAQQLLATGFVITWFDHHGVRLEPFDPDALIVRARSGLRIKFTCPSCRASAWGKASLNLFCLDCQQVLRPCSCRRPNGST